MDAGHAVRTGRTIAYSVLQACNLTQRKMEEGSPGAVVRQRCQALQSNRKQQGVQGSQATSSHAKLHHVLGPLPGMT